MKIGFVSRQSRTDRYHHQILGSQHYKPRDFATQLGAAPSAIWGIIKFFIDYFMKQEDGKFVIMRDPAKPVLRVYKVPFDAFDDDDDEDDDDDDEEEDDE